MGTKFGVIYFSLLRGLPIIEPVIIVIQVNNPVPLPPINFEKHKN